MSVGLMFVRPHASRSEVVARNPFFLTSETKVPAVR
jgi:hypothetical protein